MIERNVFFGMMTFAVPTLVVLVTYPILTGRLGDVAFGVFSLANALTGTLTFLGLGLNGATVKYVSEHLGRDDPDSAAGVLATSLLHYAAAGLAAGVAIWVAAPRLAVWLAGADGAAVGAETVFRIAALQVVFFFPAGVFVAFFKGIGRFEFSAAAVSAQSLLVYGGGAVAVLWFGADVTRVMAVSAGAHAAVLLGAAALAHVVGRRLGIRLRGRSATRAVFGKLLRFGAVMAGVALLSLLFYEIQRYVVGAAIGPAAVTVYVLAFAVTSRAHALIAQTTEVLFPLASGGEDPRAVRRVYLRMLGGSAVLGLVILAGIALVADPFMAWWVGPELGARAAPLIRVFAIGYFFVSLSPAPYHLANGIGRPGLNMLNLGLRATLNVALLAFFWWRGLGLVDIVWAFAITAFLVDGLVWIPLTELVVWRPLLAREGS